MPTMSTTPTPSLTAATATGNGSQIELSRFASNTNSIGVYLSCTGSPTTVTVAVDMSPDGGSTWFALSGGTLSAVVATCQNFSIPPGADFVRARLTVLTGGTAPTVTAKIAQRYESSV